MVASALAVLLAAASTGQAKLPLRACVVQGVPAKCGTLLVPENRDTGAGPRIPLRVVVVPSRRKPALPDAFTYLAGGPGSAATEQTAGVAGIWDAVRDKRDLLLVDQRGTGRSHPLTCPDPPAGEDDATKIDTCVRTLNGDPTQYGSAAAADDLEAVRVALGYRTLDVYGVSYGATLAQIYLARHPRSVRTLMLDGGTLLDVPFWGRFAVNGQRALDLVARRCAAATACRRAFPDWPVQLRTLIEAWNAQPVQVSPDLKLSGDGLAGVVQSLTLSAASASNIPLVVTRAARGDYAPLVRQVPTGDSETPVMFWSIWCNERWVGLDATGPWGTYLDGYTASQLQFYRSACTYVPDHPEPGSNLSNVRSQVPVLALVGGADPQDPVGNLTGLKQAMPRSRIVVVPEHGHVVGNFGCLSVVVARFVDRASASGLDLRCLRTIQPPPFVLR
jgi:pimeloyl-ACP methyl ester carboxylesterase